MPSRSANSLRSSACWASDWDSTTTLRLTAEVVKIQSAPFGVACRKTRDILPSLVAPNCAPKLIFSNAALRSIKRLRAAQSRWRKPK